MKKITGLVSGGMIGISLLIRGSVYALPRLHMLGRGFLVVTLWYFLQRFAPHSRRTVYNESIQLPLMRISSVGFLSACMIENRLGIVFRGGVWILVRNQHLVYGEKGVLFLMGSVFFAYALHSMHVGIDENTLFVALSAGMIALILGYAFTGTGVNQIGKQLPFLIVLLMWIISGIVVAITMFR